MKILFVGTLPPHTGGSGIFNDSLLSGLAQLGHQVTAIAPTTRASEQLPDPLANANFTRRRYLLPHFDLDPRQNISAEFRALEGRAIQQELAPLLDEDPPDVVIAGRESFAWHLDEVARRGISWIALAHGGDVWEITGDPSQEGVKGALLERLATAERVVAVAHHLGQRLRQLGLENIEVVANAIDPESFTPGPRSLTLARKLEISSRDIVVAHVSNLKAIKRPLDIVQSAALTLARDPRLLYLIVGDGPELAAVQSECRRLELLSRFRFTGWIPHSEVPDHLRLADIVLMPSCAEACSLVYLETQACGRVLIASAIAAAREAIQDGVTGLLFPLGDIAALAERTLSAASDPALRARLGAQARAAIMSRPLAHSLDRYDAILAAAARTQDCISAASVGVDRTVP